MEFHRKWIAQYEAAKRIKQSFGTTSALEYLVGEKLLDFAEAARCRVDFARELPNFLNEIRHVFSLEETGNYVDKLERTKTLSPLQRRAIRAISSVSALIH